LLTGGRYAGRNCNVGVWNDLHRKFTKKEKGLGEVWSVQVTETWSVQVTERARDEQCFFLYNCCSQVSIGK